MIAHRLPGTGLVTHGDRRIDRLVLLLHGDDPFARLNQRKVAVHLDAGCDLLTDGNQRRCEEVIPGRLGDGEVKREVFARTNVVLRRREFQSFQRLAQPTHRDTNVLVDVLQDDPDWADWSIGQLRAQAQVHELAINPIIYAELSLAFVTVEALDAVVDQIRLIVADAPRPALFLAGQAFLRYRRAGGGKSNVLADFFIGAHAA